MNEFIMEQWIFVARLLGAAVCGGLIGYERQSRKKTAGVRTHVIISVAAATMMIISKYGFNDVLNEYTKLDPSRVAAGVVTAIGFLGSGMIIARNKSVSGITTSAGIWATVGVGLAVGSGMIYLGIATSVIVVLVEMFLGRGGIMGLHREAMSAVNVEISGGQKELLEAIAGLQVTEAGEIYYIEDDGSREMLIGKDPLKIAEMGVSLSFVPEDRLGMGLVGNMDLTDNMMLRSFRRGRTPFTNRKPPKKLAKDVVENLEVVTPGITTPIRRLSGGNVQKVLVGREIASAPTVLLTAYAVRGLDINSSYTIYELINEQKKKGVAVIFVGEDLDVLLELSDKILVLCGGKVSGIVDARKTDKNEVGMMMTRVGGSENHE